PGGHEIAPASHVEHQAPFGAALHADTTRAGPNQSAAFSGVERGERHETRVVSKAIRIFEAAFGAPPKRRPERVMCEIDDAGRRKDVAPRKEDNSRMAQPPDSSRDAGPGRRAPRGAWAKSKAAPCAASLPAREVPRAPAAAIPPRGIAARHGPAWSRRTTSPTRDRSARPAERASPALRRRGQCRCR